eukprot:5834103-Pyramimonas_sp.AAC.1
MDRVLRSLRTGEGRWDFLRAAHEEFQWLSIRELLDWFSPDTMFEKIEETIITAGRKHFEGRQE